MGGKSSPDNQQIVDEQKAQAADAAAKEADRQKRLSTGLDQIKAAFEGTAVTAPTSHTYDWSTYTPTSTLPEGYTRVQVDAKGNPIPGTPAKAATKGGLVSSDPYATGYSTPGTASLVPAKAATSAIPAPTSVGTTAIKGPKGMIYNVNDPLSYTTNDPTGEITGGFQDKFYDDYNKSILDWYLPQVDKQLTKAKDQITYDSARAGTLNSSAVNTANADLLTDDATARASIANQADQQTAAKRSEVAGLEQKSIDQLYATENPDIATTQALADVRNVSLDAPTSVLGDVFKAVTIGAAKIANNSNNNNFIGGFTSSLPPSTGSGTIVGT